MLQAFPIPAMFLDKLWCNLAVTSLQMMGTVRVTIYIHIYIYIPSGEPNIAIENGDL